ncbi:apoptotic protease-activating factor 1-like [Ptychodera flava]|uniref:apoptotic protease-activating factor 1-like n=1 Tax=Ptychodera flava TaxID=63121 RepID=UPI003969D17B
MEGRVVPSELIHKLGHDLTMQQCLDLVRHLDLPHHIIEDVTGRRNTPINVEAFNSELLLGLLNHRRDTNVTHLIGGLSEIGRVDLVEELEAYIADGIHGMDLLPSEYVERPDHIEPLLQLVKQAGSAPIGISDGVRHFKRPEAVGIKGLGGTGKTILAQALAYEVRKQLNKEVVWLTLSQEPDIPNLLAEICYYLTGETTAFPNEKTGQRWLRDFTKKRKIFLILDDVWNGEHVRPFNVMGPNCNILITTRSQTVLKFVRAQGHVVDKLEADHARKMLLNYANISEETVQQNNMHTLVKNILLSLKLFPLALAVIGSSLRDTERGPVYVEKWKNTLEDLQKRQAFWEKTENVKLCDYNDTLMGAFDVSFDFLGRTGQPFDAGSLTRVQERLLDLAIFPEDVAIPRSVLAMLWGISLQEAEKDIEELVDSSFVTRAKDPTMLKVHDLVLQYVKYRYEEVHGDGSLQGRHCNLLNCYQQSIEQDSGVNMEILQGAASSSSQNTGEHVQWWNVANDNYVYRNILHHLLEANKWTEAESLLLNYSWVVKKLNETDIASLIFDYEYFQSIISPQQEVKNGIKLIHTTLTFTARVLAIDKKQLPTQLLGTLVTAGDVDVDLFLHQVKQDQYFNRPLALEPSLHA